MMTVEIPARAVSTNSLRREDALIQARTVRLLLLDVDGVLSDGRISYGSEGMELKSFHTQDGFGLRLLRQSGIATGIITGRSSEAVRRRAAELKLSHLYENATDKLVLFKDILRQEEIPESGQPKMKPGNLRPPERQLFRRFPGSIPAISMLAVVLQ